MWVICSDWLYFGRFILKGHSSFLKRLVRFSNFSSVSLKRWTWLGLTVLQKGVLVAVLTSNYTQFFSFLLLFFLPILASVIFTALFNLGGFSPWLLCYTGFLCMSDKHYKMLLTVFRAVKKTIHYYSCFSINVFFCAFWSIGQWTSQNLIKHPQFHSLEVVSPFSQDLIHLMGDRNTCCEEVHMSLESWLISCLHFYRRTGCFLCLPAYFNKSVKCGLWC